MPIIDLQRRIVESGRIRIGHQVQSNGKSRPAKLEQFRLTSADRRRIEQAAEAFGGDVSEWAAPAGKQWEVITKADSLDVIVPPSDLSFSQHYELWAAGGCKRRCDGAWEQIGDQDCVCDPDNRECDIHTRLSVMLRDLPGLGVWRIDTSGYYAAVELSGAVQVIQAAAGRGALLPARLRLEQRSVKRGGQTRRFAVPVLDIEISPSQLLSGGASPMQLADTPAPLTPVPQLPAGSGPTIAEQSQPPGPRPRRRNAAPEIPASGRSRRSTEQPESPPAEEEEPANQPKHTPDDPDYWTARVHAAGGEKDLDHDDLRLIAAALKQIPADEIAEWSMTSLSDSDWEGLDKLIRRLPATLDLDAATMWIWPIAEHRNLADWDAIDPLVTAAYGKQPDDVTVAEWIAFGLRLHAGEYDAKPDPVPVVTP